MIAVDIIGGCAIICAAVLNFYGRDLWGWFLFVGFLLVSGAHGF